MKNLNNRLALSGVTAALYFVLTVLFAPISFGIIQFRISEALCVLPLFFPECAVGLIVGCFLANLFGNGVFDLLFGTLATAIAAIITIYIGKKNKGVLGLVSSQIVNVLANAFIIPIIFVLSGSDAGYFYGVLTVGLGEVIVFATFGSFVYFFVKKLFLGRTTYKRSNMFKILTKKVLNPTVTLMEVDAPLIAKKAEPGQFIILRTDDKGERIPLTIADFDRQKGSVTIIFQIVGATTMKLNALSEGDSLHDFVGPLGKPTETDNIKKVAVIGGGVGSAIAYPIAKKLFLTGATVHTIVGFREKNLVILENEFKSVSHNFTLVTDDGSYGNKGLVTDALKNLIESGNKYDEVIAIGPLVMMKFVCKLTKEYNIKTIVSMNPIMIDGTGMCGGCRLTVGGVTKFACVDGPDFDGHLVDFDEAMERGSTYRDFETNKRNEQCNLFTKEIK